MRTVQFQLMVPSPTVKKLIIVNAAIWFVLQFMLEDMILRSQIITDNFGLTPSIAIENFYIWQFFTYIFLHGNFMHLLFNMLGLWFFGSELEMRWGSKLFLTYYLFTGVVAGFLYVLCMAVYGLISGAAPMAYHQGVVGASGAIFGILLAYGVLFGDRMVYFFGVFPLQARYFVGLVALIEIVTLMSKGLGSNVANLAHLGGLVAGAIFLLGWTRFQQLKWRKTSASRRNLKLVVNKDDDPQSGPKFWN